MCRCCSSIRSRTPDAAQMVATARDWMADKLGATPIVIAASAPPDKVAALQQMLGRDAAGALVEQTLAHIAEDLVARGVRRLVVAGGETAGAVVSRLGVRSLRIGGGDRSRRALDLCRRRRHAAAAGAEVGQFRRARLLPQGDSGQCIGGRAADHDRGRNPPSAGGARRQPVRPRLLRRQRRQHQRAPGRRLSDHADQLEPRAARSGAAVAARCRVPARRRRQAIEGGVHAPRVLSRAAGCRRAWCICTRPWRPRSPACPMSMRRIRSRR